MPRAFRLLEEQSPNSGGPEYPAQTRVRAIALGSARQGGTRAIRVRIDSAEGWLFLWPSQIRACPPGSVAQRAGDVSLGAGEQPPPPEPPPAAGPSSPSPSQPPRSSMIGTVVDPSWVSPGVDELSRRMTRRARQFLAGFTAVTDIARFEVPAGANGVLVPGTLGPGFCYRVAVVSGAAAEAVELGILTVTGHVINAERVADGLPLIGFDRPLCVPHGAPALATNIRVRVLSGAASGAIQVFARPM
jgi:hypothetical protein